MQLLENPVLIREFRLRARGPKIFVAPAIAVVYTAALWILAFVVLPSLLTKWGAGAAQMGPFGQMFTPHMVFVGGVGLYLSFMLKYILPAMLAITVARERENRSLDFLLLTALTPKDILLGKLIAVSSPIWLSALVMIPFLILAPGDYGSLAGIVLRSPLMTALYAVAVVTSTLAVVLTSLSLSVLCRKVSSAVAASYGLVIIGYPMLQAIVSSIVQYGLLRALPGQPMNIQPGANPFAIMTGTMQASTISSAVSGLVVLAASALLTLFAFRSLNDPTEH